MGRDLAACHYVWDDVCTDRLPFDQFIQFVVYAPPGTAVYHLVNEGWTPTTHKVADHIQYTKMLISMKTQDPKATFRDLGEDVRPGVKKPAPVKEHITIGEYMRLSGLDGGNPN